MAGAKSVALKIGLPIWLLACIMPATVASQAARFIDRRDGLLSNTVKGVAVDRDGFVWACSTKGLYRFDGYRLKPYNQANLDSSQAYRGSCFALFADSKNRIWICTEKGVVIFDQRVQRFFYPKIDRFQAGTFIRGCCQDKDSNVYLCGNAGLFRYHESSHTVQPLFSSRGPVKNGANMYWKTIAYDPLRNGIWCGTAEKGVCLWDLSTQKLMLMDQVFTSLKGRVLQKPVSLLSVESDRTMWFAYSRTAELQSVDLQTGELTLYAKKWNTGKESYDNYFLQMAYGSSRRKWIAGRRYGIYYVGLDNEGVQQFQGDYGTVYGVAVDAAGNTWFGSSKGLVKVGAMESEIRRFPIPFADHETEFPLMRTLVNNGQVLLATTDRGVQCFNPESGRLSSLAPVKNSAQNNVYDFGQWPDGRLWLCTWDNLLVVSAGNASPLFAEHSEAYNYLQGKVVRAAVAAGSGNYYVANAEQGIGYANTKGQWLCAPVAYPYLNRDMFALAHLRDGTLLAGGEQGTGMVWLSADLKLLRYHRMCNGVKDSLDNSRFCRIYEDKAGQIWLFSYKGIQLYYRQTGRFEQVKGPSGVEGMAYPANESDEHLLVCTASRMVKISKQSHRVEGSISASDLQVAAFSGNAAMDEQGNIWVAAGKELLCFSEGMLQRQTGSYRLIPSAMKVFDAYHHLPPGNSGISLHHNENFFTLFFTDFDNNPGSGKSFSYRLQGFDNRWYRTASPEMSYTNVPPGSYTLELTAELPSGISHHTTFAVTVLPPWWQTWWFRLMAVVVALLLVVVLFRIYIAAKLRKQKQELAKLQALQQERLRISAEIHDDLGSELTSIRLVSEVVKQRLGPAESAVAREIDFISSTSSTMVDRLNQIVWALNPENDQSQSLITYSRHYLIQYFGQHNLRCTASLPQPIPEVEISTQKRQNLFLCIKELAHNVVKHSGATEVSFSFSIQPGLLLFELKDNGKNHVNFESILEATSGNGLRNMQRRMESIGGQFSIRFESGTVAKLHLSV